MIQNAVSHAIAVSVAIGKIRLNAEIAFYIVAKARFGQLKNLSNTAVSSWIGHILNHCLVPLIVFAKFYRYFWTLLSGDIVHTRVGVYHFFLSLANLPVCVPFLQQEVHGRQ